MRREKGGLRFEPVDDSKRSVCMTCGTRYKDYSTLQKQSRVQMNGEIDTLNCSMWLCRRGTDAPRACAAYAEGTAGGNTWALVQTSVRLGKSESRRGGGKRLNQLRPRRTGGSRRATRRGRSGASHLVSAGLLLPHRAAKAPMDSLTSRSDYFCLNIYEIYRKYVHPTIT